MGRLNSQEELKKVRKRLSELGLNKKRKFEHLICCKCRGEFAVRVSDPSIYTDEVRKTWTCYPCSFKK
jgi:hypothetical protein